MKVLLDTNVVLDVLLERGEWLAEASIIWQASADGRLESCVTASSLTDIYYISRRLKGKETARQTIQKCLQILTILAVNKETLEQAYSLDLADFEDAVQIASAARNRLDAILTRNPKDFIGSSVRVLSPTDLVTALRT